MSPKSNQEIWLAKSVALIFVVKPGFASFGVEVASSTSSPMRFGSFGSPTERRLRRREVLAVSSVATVLFVGTACPAERGIASFLSSLVEVASTVLFSGVTTSRLGAVDVAGTAEAADVAVLVLEAALVDAGAVIAAFAS